MNVPLIRIATGLLLGIICLFISTGISYAQENFDDEQGEIVEEEVIINKDLKIELPPAQRLFEKVPPQVTEVD